MSTLKITNLQASVTERKILNGIDLEVGSGEVHAIMGPNGSGKSTLSHVLMGKSGYIDVSGSITVDGEEMIEQPTYERARHGLFLAMQYPIEVPGVSMRDVLFESTGSESIADRMTAEAERVGLDTALLERPMNVDLSGGEKKRNETVMLGVLRPKFAVLDEIDSGLDVDALRAVSRRVEAETKENNLGVLAITHYSRLLTELRPDRIHVLVGGRIVESGGPELADELERTGYARFGGADEVEDSAPLARHERPEIVDPWGGNPQGDRGGSPQGDWGGSPQGNVGG